MIERSSSGALAQGRPLPGVDDGLTSSRRIGDVDEEARRNARHEGWEIR
jgi:hypothetical protein